MQSLKLHKQKYLKLEERKLKTANEVVIQF